MKPKKSCYAAKGLPKVPGKPRGTDIIPAWLTPGEAVLSPGAAEMLGRGNVQALNKAASTLRLGTPQYKADGGLMDDQQAEAQRIVGNPDQYDPATVQAAQDYLNQMQQEPQYFMGGTAMVPRLGTVQPGYYGMGTNMVLGQQPQYLAGGMDFVDELAKQNKALVPKGPLVSTPYGSVGPGQGFPVQPSAINTGPASIPKPPPTFNGRAGGFSVGGYEPFKAPPPAPSAMASARGAINTGATPIGDLASSAAKGLGNVANTAGNMASKAVGAVGNLAKSTAVGAARVGPAAMGIAGAYRGLNTPTENYAQRIGIDTPISVPGQLGVRALGVLSDVGAAGLGALGIDQRGRFADVAAQRAQGGVQSAPNPVLGRPAQADTTPSAGNVMGPPKPQGLGQSRSGTLPTSGGAYYLDAQSARNADMARASDPGYVTTPTGSMATLQTTPEELAKQNAMWSQLDKMNAAQPRLGTSAVARQAQPAQQMAMPSQQSQSAPRLADPDTQAYFDRYTAYQNSPQRLVDMEADNMRQYWSTVESLKQGLDYAGDPETARTYAAALGGLRGAGPDAAKSGASMYGSDAAKYNSGLDYDAKMSELGAGQGLRDAQMQEAMARAGNLTSDANLQNAMAANPERFAGMRLGSRGAAGGNGLKLEKYSAGMEGGDKFALFNPEDQSLTEIQPQLKPTPAEQKKLSQLKAAYPDADEESLINYIRSMFNAK